MPQLSRSWRRGGLRGPALDAVATRLTRDQLIRQVIQGSGNMPAYGKNLRPAQASCARLFHGNLAAFVSTCCPGFEQATTLTNGPSRYSRTRILDGGLGAVVSAIKSFARPSTCAAGCFCTPSCATNTPSAG